MFGKRTSRTPQAKFRGKAATLSLTHYTGIRPRDHSVVSRGQLERATCGKLRCRGPFSSFLTNPFICFECYSNIERINEGIISNAKHEQQNRIPETPLAQPMSGLVTATCFDWHRGCQLSRALCVIPLKIHGNYRSCIYSVATVIQREREAMTIMAAG